MNSREAQDAPLFLMSDEEMMARWNDQRLMEEIVERWNRAMAFTAPPPVRPVAPPQNAKKGHPTGKERVLAVLLDCRWHFGYELCGPEVGGSEGLRRLRELRKDWIIEMRKRDGRASREYRLIDRKAG